MTSSRRPPTDPITLELVKNALDAIVDEMAIALVRTAYSNNLKNSMDMSCALCDAQGRLIAQGLTLPLHLGSVPDAMAAVTRKFAGKVRPGDVFILNDPFEGGTHLPDFYILKPIHVGSDLVGWSASIGHQLDVGGKTPGGNGCDATEIFQEGLRIPPVRLYDRGEPAEAVFDFIDKNVRVPRQVLGDVRSQVAACLTGERGYLALLGRHGREGFCRMHECPPRTGGAACAERHQGHAGWRLPVRRPHRRRWHRPRPHPDRGDGDSVRRPPGGRLHRLGAAGEGRDQLADPIHQVSGLRVRPPSHWRRPAEQRGLLPSDRGGGAPRDHRRTRSCRRPLPHAG